MAGRNGACTAPRTRKMLTVIMYHYVRDLAHSPYPGIKGRTTTEFDAQLDYLERHYSVVSFQDVIAASRGAGELPEAPCVLTFDDGLIDHFETVFPRLVERGLPAAFFPSALPILHGVVLDVHKLHFVLASCADHDRLLRDVYQLIAALREQHGLGSDEELAARYGLPGKYDAPTTAFLKRLLQHGLPIAVREQIVGELFRRHVAVDEQTFSRELYMDMSQLRRLLSHGMEIGGHGHRHEHIGLLSREQQIEELTGTRTFLNSVHERAITDWIMCFPYGSFSPESLTAAADLGCSVALSCEAALVPLPLQQTRTPVPVIDRLDTNDVPFGAFAAPCEWTLRAGE
jgi:peptidoglycan/xylan/chitin deacetylase (PgdA/CDA1 family)